MKIDISVPELFHIIVVCSVKPSNTSSNEIRSCVSQHTPIREKIYLFDAFKESELKTFHIEYDNIV